ncbi:hypothetical protein HMPREF0281_02589 [Corynebacterium ammoniagenes DSM 20306]|uniref:Uncharacterized protein n=1 Tax=Corynebacterium ammoniagenes DSM 20306 TaxID=649754 RepID=A0ABP2IDD3_CORAM|nr:hypothetical protein HMPREF0281_02589 [Corynebacterium ammoniagenes DSM 20306]
MVTWDEQLWYWLHNVLDVRSRIAYGWKDFPLTLLFSIPIARKTVVTPIKLTAFSSAQNGHR